MGKAYANRRPIEDRPESDFYETPYSLVWELFDSGWLDGINGFHDPCCGNGNIKNAAVSKWPWLNGKITESDITTDGVDFLSDNTKRDFMIFNPPFSLFDEFIMHSKEVCDRFVCIGKVNFFGAYQRYRNGVWDYLNANLIFSRQVDYRTPHREDGLFNVGNLVTGWFIFNKKNNNDTWETGILDVQKYAKLGQIKE